MITPCEFWYKIVDIIQKDFTNSTEKKVVIFSSSEDCDAIYASRLLWRMLSVENISYTQFPVTTTNQVKNICQKDQEEDDEVFRTYIFINCCGTNNIRKLFNIPSQNTRIVVIDSIRPIHHSFQNDEDNVTVFVVAKNDPQQIHDVLDLSTENTSTDADELIDNDTKQALYYSQGNYYGKPSTLVLNECAKSKGLTIINNLFNWLTICALTDSYIFRKLSDKQYGDYLLEIENQVQWSNQQVENKVDDEEGRLPSRGLIKFIQEYQFWLYRHRSLYESLKYSPYIASRLQTWKEKGIKELETIIIKMGIPLLQTQQNFYAMKKPYRTTLTSILTNRGEEYGLKGAWFPSYEYKSGNSQRMGAVDFVLLTVATLIHNSLNLQNQGNKENQENVNQQNGQLEKGEDDINDQFWKTIEILDFEKFYEQQQSIQYAINLIKAIVEEGGLIISRKEIQGGLKAQFWSVNLSEQKFVNHDLLGHHLSLRLFGIFLQSCKIISSGVKKDMVLVGPEGADKFCWVVAIPGSHATNTEDQGGQTMVFAFEITLKKIRAQYIQIGFDKFQFKLHKASIHDFLVTLDEVVKDQEEQKQYIKQNDDND